MPFMLHKTLEEDTHFVTDLPFSRVLLMNDRQFPWLILVPRKMGLREIFDMEKSERTVLIEEVNHCAQVLQEMTGAYKMNVATLGNVVSQMHVHVVAREKDDEAWPNPVWGNGSKQPYEESELRHTLDRLAKNLVLS